MKVSAYTVFGFVVGAVLGFMWSSEAKKKATESVTTSFSDGVLTVQFDTKTLALEGVKGWIE